MYIRYIAHRLTVMPLGLHMDPVNAERDRNRISPSLVLIDLRLLSDAATVA